MYLPTAGIFQLVGKMAMGKCSNSEVYLKIPLDRFHRYAERIRSDETYDVFDLADRLNHLTVSETILHPGKSTKGHRHDNQEEVYLFLKGEGSMEIDDLNFPVEEKDLVLIRAGRFHRVYNTMNEGDLRVLCVFEKYGEREQEAKQVEGRCSEAVE